MWWSFPHDFHDLRHQRLEGVRSAVAHVRGLLDSAVQAEDRLILAGFSQGAMLALEVAVSDPRPLAGLILFSGTLLDEAALTPRLAARRGLPVFVSHGRQDDVLPFARSEELVGGLRGAGLEVEFHPEDGGHAITNTTSTQAAAFVRRVGR